jgi:hypothetical protein
MSTIASVSSYTPSPAELQAVSKGHHHHGSKTASTPATSPTPPVSTPASAAAKGSAVDSDGDHDGSKLNATA